MNPKNIIGIEREYEDPGRYFLLIPTKFLRSPSLGFPLSPFIFPFSVLEGSGDFVGRSNVEL